MLPYLYRRRCVSYASLICSDQLSTVVHFLYFFAAAGRFILRHSCSSIRTRLPVLSELCLWVAQQANNHAKLVRASIKRLAQESDNSLTVTQSVNECISIRLTIGCDATTVPTCGRSVFTGDSICTLYYQDRRTPGLVMVQTIQVEIVHFYDTNNCGASIKFLAAVTLLQCPWLAML